MESSVDFSIKLGRADVDRLTIIAKELGVSLDELFQMMVKKFCVNYEFQKKLDELVEDSI